MSVDAYKFTDSTQPRLRSGDHWPEICVEVYGHWWLHIYQCPRCMKEYEFSDEEFGNSIGVTCLGSSAHLVKEG